MASSKSSRAGMAIARNQGRQSARKSKLDNAADAYLASAGFDDKGSPMSRDQQSKGGSRSKGKRGRRA